MKAKYFLVAITLCLVSSSLLIGYNFLTEKFALAESECVYQIEDNDEILTDDYLDFYAIPSSYFTYSNNGGAEGNSVLSNAFDRNFQTTFVSEATQNNGVSNPSPEQVFLNNIDINFNDKVKIDRIVYACGQRNGTPWGYPVTLSVYYDNGEELKLFKEFTSTATTNFVVFDFEQELEVSSLRLEYTSLLIRHSWKATAREIIFLQKECEEFEVYKNLFTDYCRTSVNQSISTYQKLCQFEDKLKDNVNFLESNQNIERAKKVLSGEVEFNSNFEFSTNPTAKNVIERNGNLESYCKNDLLLSSFGTNRQVLGITANANDKITIFVEAEPNDPLPKIRFSQHNGHWRSWLGGELQLKIGKNSFIVPSFKHDDYTVDVALGGGIYLSNPYTSSQQSSNVKIYIEGGTSYPVFDSSKNESEYLAEIDRYCEKYNADPQNVVNITEIVTDHMIITADCTVAKEIYSNFSPKQTVKNWNEYMDKLLEFGGISQDSKSAVFDERNLIIRFNIRTTQPWSGGWMYAYGEHIGVRQSSQNILFYASGFGWGISHEIGHSLDNKLRVISETSNNMWSKFNETAIEKACTRGEFEKTLKTLSNDLTYDDGNFFLDTKYNYLIWWYIEAWQNGYWGNLENCYRGLNTTLNKFLSKNEDLVPLISSLSPTELQVFYSSIVTKVDLSYYFDRWGYSVENDSDSVFKIASVSDNFKEIMARAVKQKYIDNTKQYKLWYQDCYYYFSNNKTIYSSKTKPTISVVAKTTAGYSIFIDHKDKSGHLGYEILEGNDTDGYKVIGFTRENFFVDETTYSEDYQPKYKIRAVDNTFSLSGESKAKEVEKNDNNICRIGETYFASLQDAINYSQNGDIIELLESFLSVNVIINKNLTIKVADDIQGDVTITKIEGGDLFTISSGCNLTLFGREKANLILNGHNFTQNGSLLNIGGIVYAENVKLSDNITSSNGGGIILQNNSKGSIFKNCLILNNSANNGGGVFCGYPATSITFENCIFDNNRADADGIIKNKGTMTLDNCQIINNSSNLGTINNYEGGVLTIKNSLISKNNSKIGGGFYIDGKTDIINCVISKNTASESAGGIFYSTNGNSRTLTIDNVEFSKNVAPKGNDIVIDNGKMFLSNIKTYSRSQILLNGGETKIKNDCVIKSKITISQEANLILQNGLFDNIQMATFNPKDVDEEMRLFSTENFEMNEDDSDKIKFSGGYYKVELREDGVYCIKIAKPFNWLVIILPITFVSFFVMLFVILQIKRKKSGKKFKNFMR